MSLCAAYHLPFAMNLFALRGLRIMTSLKSIGLGLVMALIASSAFGFQEQSGGSGNAQPSAAPQVEAPAAAAVAPSSAQDIGSAGREVRIPGIGRLGVLPKMDFGLELLYGASDAKPAEAPRDNSEDLTIRGSVKHRF